jgi:hypothetical protein
MMANNVQQKDVTVIECSYLQQYSHLVKITRHIMLPHQGQGILHILVATLPNLDAWINQIIIALALSTHHLLRYPKQTDVSSTSSFVHTDLTS